MNILAFIGGIITASILWVLYIKTANQQREEFRKSIAKKDAELLVEKMNNSFHVGYGKARKKNDDMMLEVMLENTELQNKIEELERQLRFIKGKTIIEAKDA